MNDKISFNNDPFAGKGDDAKQRADQRTNAPVPPGPPPEMPPPPPLPTPGGAPAPAAMLPQSQAPTGAPLSAPPPMGRSGSSATAKNWLGIVGLVTALVCFAPLGLIFGLLSIQANRKGEANNMGLGIAATAVGGLFSLVGGVLIGAGIFTAATTEGTYRQPDDVAVGECLTAHNLGTDTVNLMSVRVISCNEPHYAQVYYKGELDYSDYPGDLTVTTDVENICYDESIRVYQSAQDPTFYTYIFYPTSGSWRTGDRSYTCLVITDHPDNLIVGTRLD